MPNRAERTLKMREEYVSLRQQGLTPKQIADKFQLSPATVYNNLAAIATANGTTRDSLLQIPRSPHITHERQFAPLDPINPQDFHDGADAAIAEINTLISAVNDHIRTQCPVMLEEED